MPRRSSTNPTEREMELLEVLWRKDGATVAEIIEALDGSPAYTTIVTMLKIMEEKGYVKGTREGRSVVYRPSVSKEEVERRFLRDVLRRVFGGSATRLMARLLSSEEVSEEEIEEIKRLIALKEEGRDLAPSEGSGTPG